MTLNAQAKTKPMKLFKNALIYDGTGRDAFKGDILIENDRIIKVEECITPKEGWEIIELDGLSVSPGFIDAHSHNDWFAIKKDTSKYFEPFIRQGITSFVTGNCGLSAWRKRGRDPRGACKLYSYGTSNERV